MKARSENRPDPAVLSPESHKAFAYASHLDPSITCALQTGELWPSSSVMELGCGEFSTPALSAVCRFQQRRLAVVSSDTTWQARYGALVRHKFDLMAITNDQWESFQLPDQLGFALVDNEQRVRERIQTVTRLAKPCKVVLLHDANVIIRTRQLWQPVLDQFDYCFVYRERHPYTAVLSNYVDPSPWFDGAEA